MATHVVNGHVSLARTSHWHMNSDWPYNCSISPAFTKQFFIIFPWISGRCILSHFLKFLSPGSVDSHHPKGKVVCQECPWYQTPDEDLSAMLWCDTSTVLLRPSSRMLLAVKCLLSSVLLRSSSRMLLAVKCLLSLLAKIIGLVIVDNTAET